MSDTVTISKEEYRDLKFYEFYRDAVQDCLGPADWDINKDIEDCFVREFGVDALPEEMKRERLEHEELRRKEAGL